MTASQPAGDWAAHGIGSVLTTRPPDAPMVADGDRVATAGDVVREVDTLMRALDVAGVGPAARVCVVLPNDLGMAVTALAVMSLATFAPLDHRLTAAEYTMAFERLGADALISRTGFAPDAHAAAARAGLAIVDRDAGDWSVLRRAGRPAPHEPGVHALLLHTSGTTAAPKLIGLSADNLLASARSIASTLALTGEDRCLTVMPLFHIHGLVGTLLSSVVAGGSLHVLERFEPGVLMARLADPSITWTSAVPSVFQALVTRCDPPARPPGLRFARSSSAPMPGNLEQPLESLLQCPLVNAYGMTEASHQMTSNPLPPGERRRGTVGRSAGADVAVFTDGAVTSAPGVLGEVVVRGPGLMAGYLAPPGADDGAWCDGWFRTGDLGRLDGDGYLTLHGRIKEIINVAGEKVSPFEVEDAVRDHPGVDDVVAFAVPGGLRGEEVGLAFVAADGGAVSPATLRAFASERLARFKVPRHVVRVDAIPLGPTGKVQRSRLATALGLTDEPSV